MKNKKILLFFTFIGFSLAGLFSCTPRVDPVYYSIVYEYNYFDDLVKYLEDGTLPPIKIDGDYRGGEFVSEGETATKPDITWQGIQPSGWYLDPNFGGYPFDFSTPITSNIKLWAKWGELTELKGVQWNVKNINLYDGDFLSLERGVLWNTIPSSLSENYFTYKFEFDSTYFDNKEALGQYVYAKGKINETINTSIVVTAKSTDGLAEYSSTLNVKINPCNRISKIEFDPIEDIKFDKSGDTRTINLDNLLKFTNEDGDRIELPTNKTVYNETSGGTCAKIDKNNNLIISDPGDSPQTITVIAYAQNSNDGTLKTATVTFKVTKTIPLIDFTLNPKKITLFYGNSTKDPKSQKINVTYNPTDATDKDLTWTCTSNINVSPDGTVSTKNYVSTGEAPILSEKVTATHNTVGSKYVDVTVVMPVSKINFTNDTITVKKGVTTENNNLKEILPATASKDCKTLTWESSNPSVATVDNDGLVTAISPGTTTIKATADAEKKYDPDPTSATYNVIVPEGVKDVSIDKKYIFLATGYKSDESIKLTITPETAIEDADIICTHSTAGIVNVTQDKSDKTKFNIAYNKAGETYLNFKVTDEYGAEFNVTCYVLCYDFTPTSNVTYSQISGSTNYEAKANPSGCSGHVSINSSYNSKPVTKIADTGFKYKDVNDVYIPKTITEVGKEAFYYCNSLSSVIFETSGGELKTINARAFKFAKDGKPGYSGIIYIGLEFCTSLETISESAFEDQFSLDNIVLPASLKTIGNNAFSGCTSLSTLTYLGSKADWKAISKGSNWHKNVKATTIKCSDGDISLDA